MIITKFLRTHELSTAVIDLVEEAKAYCILVTPYLKIWPQFERVLHNASKRGVHLTFIIRQDPKNQEHLALLNKQWGFEVYEIKDHHIKLYLNEKNCWLSSMNLYDASQVRNLEIATSVDTAKAKKEIIDNYLLADASVKHHPGKFDQQRKETLIQVDAAKLRLAKMGHCVDCNTKINGDFRRNPYRVRCKPCYHANFNEDEYQPIKFCHWCGAAHDALDDKPMHAACQEDVIATTKLARPFQNY